MKGKGTECWLLLIGRHGYNLQLNIGISFQKSAMRPRDACIGISFSVRYGSSGIGIGLEYQDATLRDTEINRKVVLYLVTYDSEFAAVSPGDRPIPGQRQGVSPLHKQPIGQRPDRPAEGRYPPALLGREKAGCHLPTVFVEPWKEMGEFGFDHLDVVKADHPKNRSRQRYVAASDGSVSITVIERRFDQVSELGHFQDLAWIDLRCLQRVEGKIDLIGDLALSHCSMELCIAICLV